MYIIPEKKVNSLESFLHIRLVLLRVRLFLIILVYRRPFEIQVEVAVLLIGVKIQNNKLLQKSVFGCVFLKS